MAGYPKVSIVGHLKRIWKEGAMDKKAKSIMINFKDERDGWFAIERLHRALAQIEVNYSYQVYNEDGEEV